MLKKFTAKNGMVIEYATPIYMISVFNKDGEEELTTNLLHPHFHQGVYRNAFGKYKRDTHDALSEFCDHLGIEEVEKGRRDGSQKTLHVKKHN